MKLVALTLALGSSLLLFQGADTEPVAPAIGKPAPAFRLNDHNGNVSTVGGEADVWTIVAFYPKALTPG